MLSLNELLELTLKTSPEQYEKELKLSPLVPKIYSVSQGNSIIKGIDQLLYEIDTHGQSSSWRVRTEIHNDTFPRIQLVELAWNGPALNDSIISEINKKYDEGRSCEFTDGRSGTRKAANYLGVVGAEIRISNIPASTETKYSARNIILFPLHYKATFQK